MNLNELDKHHASLLNWLSWYIEGDIPMKGRKEMRDFLDKMRESLKPKHYLVVVENDVEPRIVGPYDTPEERHAMAQTHRRNDPEKHDGLYILDAVGTPVFDTFSGDFALED